MMPSGHHLREAQREPGGGQVAGAGTPSGSSPEVHAGMHEAAADEDARPAPGKAPVRRGDARTLPLRLPAIGMETARGCRAGSQLPQLGQAGSLTSVVGHETGGSLGVSMGGTSRVLFRVPTGGTAQPGDEIPLGSFHTVEAAARAHDGWAAATPGRALDGTTGDERGSANAPRQRAGLTTPRRACSRPAGPAARCRRRQPARGADGLGRVRRRRWWCWGAEHQASRARV
jgi:hypothetical protein